MTARREPHTYRRDDLSRRPPITREDWIALFWLIVFAALFVGLCSVDYVQ